MYVDGWLPQSFVLLPQTTQGHTIIQNVFASCSIQLSFMTKIKAHEAAKCKLEGLDLKQPTEHLYDELEHWLHLRHPHTMSVLTSLIFL